MFKSSFIFLIMIALVVGGVLFSFKLGWHKRKIDSLVFAETVANVPDFKTFTVSDVNKSLTLNLENKFWRVKEKGNYYANLAILNKLFSNMNTSKYFSKGAPGGLEVWTEIKTPYNTVEINSLNDDLQYTPVKVDGQIWLSTGFYSLPKDDFSWLQQPIISLKKDFIEDMKVDGVSYYDTKTKWIDAMQKLFFVDVMSEEAFDAQSNRLIRKIEVVTIVGLIVKIDVYQDNWVKISYTTNGLPNSSVQKFLNDKSFLVDGWVFKPLVSFSE